MSGAAAAVPAGYSRMSAGCRPLRDVPPEKLCPCVTMGVLATMLFVYLIFLFVHTSGSGSDRAAAEMAPPIRATNLTRGHRHLATCDFGVVDDRGTLQENVTKTEVSDAGNDTARPDGTAATTVAGVAPATVVAAATVGAASLPHNASSDGLL